MNLPSSLVCWFRLDAPGWEESQLVDWLSPDETQRCARLHFELHRRRQRVACAMLRRLLADVLHCSPQDLKFGRREFGKPYLPGSSLEFNLSHSEEYAVLAVLQGGEVGLDVEDEARSVDWQRLAPRYFAPPEAQRVLSLPDGKRAFFETWTAKEAYIKAIGTGLTLPLDQFVTYGAEGWQLLDLRGARLDWQLHRLKSPFPRAVAAWVAGPAAPLPASYLYGPEGQWQTWP